MIWTGIVPYGDPERAWIDRVGKHYLQNSVPGCIFAVGVCDGVDLFGEPASGPLKGLCLIGRPSARAWPQDSTWGEVTRMVLVNCPHGMASAVLRFAIWECAKRGMVRLYAYHDRTRHSGCIYRKAGFSLDKRMKARGGKGWASRSGREKSGEAGKTPKTRWVVHLENYGRFAGNEIKARDERDIDGIPFRSLKSGAA